MSWKNKKEETCHHPAEKVRLKHNPQTGEPVFWCLECVRIIFKVPKKHCIHAKSIGHCHICTAQQRGLLKYARRSLDEKGQDIR